MNISTSIFKQNSWELKMNKHHKEDAEEMHKNGHTFYAIVLQLEQWYKKHYTEAQIQKALGVKNNPVGRQK